ncbi:Sybindin-like family-domain-containing protein [Rhexocercosporidium sp. MPI-PUGE-AT-0058]|nr:Sybindin-like family-domain-containing protein [Rhexocercosporidium sp. MPI-PUGE-AT-0058]
MYALPNLFTLVVYALIIINKAGGLIYQRDFAEGLNKLNINDYLVLAGIEVLETENFRLQCFSTLTGTKFLLFTEPQQPNVDKIVGKIYELYADYVMKNPFYQLEMPVRCEAWERRLVGYVRPLNSR